MDKITNTIGRQSDDKLKEMAAALVSDMREDAGFVLDAVLAALSRRMPEAEFVAFCDGLE